jgi:hypothetical protein
MPPIVQGGRFFSVRTALSENLRRRVYYSPPAAFDGSLVDRQAILTNLLVVTILLGVLIASRMWRSDG